LYLVCRWF